MKSYSLALAICLFGSSTAFAQTTPPPATSGASTTRSTNNVGFGGTVNGTPTSSNASNGTPARYDDRNSGLPSEQHVRMKKPKMSKRSGKMKTTM